MDLQNPINNTQETNSNYCILFDLDETLIKTSDCANEKTQGNAFIVNSKYNQSSYTRNYLMQLLHKFVTKEINCDIGVFTKGNQVYAEEIVTGIEYQLTKYLETLNFVKDQNIFKYILYREHLNSFDDPKNLSILNKQMGTNYKIDNILLVDNLKSNFKDNKKNAIYINDFMKCNQKDNALEKLQYYLQTFDLSGKLTLTEQNVFIHVD